jgi:hypothetical protein
MSFIRKYFPNGRVYIPEENSNIQSNLLEILDVGLAPGNIEYLNNITVASFLNDIATHNATRPLLSTALFAIEPFLMLQGISEATNTSIRCIVQDCNRRLEQEQMSVEDQCEIDYVRCQLKSSFLI